ncbi:hypothetical protein BU15DRAFT_61155 [Melanogaster broomeanus]|nr:hypothetical protein BU15DRAFT_61155 [Melanogaster broomeanus]
MSDRDYYPVTGRKSTGIVSHRLPIDELQNNYPHRWTLFVLGYAWINNTPIPFPGVPVEQPPLEDAISLMEIGGIHGKPYREWAGDPRTPTEAQADYNPNDKKDTNPVPSRFGGYCNKPLEVMLTTSRNKSRMLSLSEGPTWITAARLLRFPYWDWADPKVDTEPFPSVFYADELTIRATKGKTMEVPNPLSFYGSATSLGLHWRKQGTTSLHTTICGHGPSGVQTRTKEGNTDIDRVIRWDQFSNSLNESRQPDDTTAIGSLESVHGSIHSYVGHPDYAGFDPFFYFALWEWCYTDHWMNKGYTVGTTENSWTQQAGTYYQVYNERIVDEGEFGVLAPFRREDGTYWTNNDTRFLTSYAYPKYYTYKEFLGINVEVPPASKHAQQEARARIAKYYSVDPQRSARETNRVEIPVPGVGEISLPSNFTSIRGFRLFVILARLPEHAFGHSYDLRIYYKETKLVGNVSVFARPDNSPCKACAYRRTNTAVVRGVILIPPRIVNEIIVESGIDRSTNTMEITTELITRALTGKLLDVSGKLLASAKGGDNAEPVRDGESAAERVRPVEVSLVSSGVAEHVNDSKQPVYLFDWNSHKALFPSGWKAEDVDATQV